MADQPMPSEIIEWMAERNWGMHHIVWHLARIWDLIGSADRAWVQMQGGGRAERQEGERGNGMDFLAMHRVMIRQLKERFPESAALFDGWTQPPTDPDDQHDPVPDNGAPRPFSQNMLTAVNRLHTQIGGFQSDDDLGLYIQTRLRPRPGQPQALSNDPTTGIHNYLHGRFTDESSDIDMGNPMVNINNRQFWRLHGWIDARWSAFREVRGLAEDEPAYRQALEEAAYHMGGHHEPHHHDLLLAPELEAKRGAIPEVASRFFRFLAERTEQSVAGGPAETRIGLDARLWCPQDVYVNLRPPVPNKVPVVVQIVAFLTNTGGVAETLFATTPCDIHYWELFDSAGQLVQSEPPEECVDVVAQRELAAGETLRGDSTVVLDGKLLRDGERYRLKYQFWGGACEDGFTAHLLF